MHLVDHILVVLLAFVSPIWDWFDTRALKANPTRQGRLRYYKQTIIILAVGAIVACWAHGIRSFLTLEGLGIHEPLLERHSWLWWLLTALVVLAVLVQWALPVTQILVKYRKLPYLEMQQLQPLRFVLPASRVERRWYAVLSVTAACCEELLVRGFFLRYLHTSPFHLGLGVAVLVAAAVFGANHIYQGVKGAIVTGLTGLVFTAFLLVTGSLWPGMVCHAVTNLSVLLFWRPKPTLGTLQ
ncbi:MAG: protease family protein [Verrucomicrobiota bacterium]|jgi:membrane protease YdiL (CAAX protease family)